MDNRVRDSEISKLKSAKRKLESELSSILTDKINNFIQKEGVNIESVNLNELNVNTIGSNQVIKIIRIDISIVL